MFEYISALNTVFDLFHKVHKGYKSLKASNLSLKETDINNIVESFFGYQETNNKKVKLVGKLSPYTINTNLITYTPEFITNVKKTSETTADFTLTKLSVPSFKYNSIKLEDGSSAKIIWLLPRISTGLILDPYPQDKEASISIDKSFVINDSQKPIMCFLSTNYNLEDIFYKEVEIIGKVVSAPITLMNSIIEVLDPLMINYYSNSYRPFSSNEGIMAIDLRGHEENIRFINQKPDPFKLIYTIQGALNVPQNNNDLISRVIKTAASSVPTRNELGKVTFALRSEGNQIGNILSTDNIGWQLNEAKGSFAAFIELDPSNRATFQSNFTKLVFNWQSWQKKARNSIREQLGIEVKINPIMCSNSDHSSRFHPDGLIIPKELEERILSEQPEVRESIDWLRISTGK